VWPWLAVPISGHSATSQSVSESGYIMAVNFMETAYQFSRQKAILCMAQTMPAYQVDPSPHYRLSICMGCGAAMFRLLTAGSDWPVACGWRAGGKASGLPGAPEGGLMKLLPAVAASPAELGARSQSMIRFENKGTKHANNAWLMRRARLSFFRQWSWPPANDFRGKRRQADNSCQSQMNCRGGEP